MLRMLAALTLIAGVAAQDPPVPKAQILVKSGIYTSAADLWAEVREVDPVFKALGAEIARIAKGLESDEIGDRTKASTAIRTLGLSAYGAIRDERDRAKSAQVRLELDAILQDLQGALPGTPAVPPATRTVDKAQAGALNKRLDEKKIRRVLMPAMVLLEGAPGNIFIGDEIPIVGGRRRLKVDRDGNRITLEEQRRPETVKFGSNIRIHARIPDATRKTVELEVAVTNSHLVRPIREIDTPLGKESHPEVIELGIDLFPVIDEGRAWVAGPFPSADPKGEPWWIVIEVEVVKR